MVKKAPLQFLVCALVFFAAGGAAGFLVVSWHFSVQMETLSTKKSDLIRDNDKLREEVDSKLKESNKRVEAAESAKATSQQLVDKLQSLRAKDEDELLLAREEIRTGRIIHSSFDFNDWAGSAAVEFSEGNYELCVRFFVRAFENEQRTHSSFGQLARNEPIYACAVLITHAVPNELNRYPEGAIAQFRQTLEKLKAKIEAAVTGSVPDESYGDPGILGATLDSLEKIQNRIPPSETKFVANIRKEIEELRRQALAKTVPKR